MVRTKNPENKTKEQSNIRKTLEKVSNVQGRSEKTSWKRKMRNMIVLVDKVHVLEEQIIGLQSKKNPLIDSIQELRQVMVDECVHPQEYLVLHEKHIECKFCNRKISIPKWQTKKRTS